jgi:hypothetical protein
MTIFQYSHIHKYQQFNSNSERDEELKNQLVGCSNNLDFRKVIQKTSWIHNLQQYYIY